MKYFFVLLCFLGAYGAMAQNGSVSIQPIYDTAAKTNETGGSDFCALLMQLVNDASNNFAKTKGKESETHADVAIWTANKGLPGAITSSFLFTDKWHYEGVVYEGISATDMQLYYNKYKKDLDDCLPGKGYSVRHENDTASRFAHSPRVVYATNTGNAMDKSPYVTIKVDFADETGTYTVSVNVWE